MHHLSHIVLYFALGLVGGFALAYALFRKQAGSNTTNSNGSPSLSEPSSSTKTTKTKAKEATEEAKMVLCVRTDLKMTKGKMCAQSGHATLGAYRTAEKKGDPYLKPWLKYGQTKIALKVSSEEELLTLEATADSLGIITNVVADAGRTQIAAGSLTVLAVGPGPRSLVDQVTGHLKLL